MAGGGDCTESKDETGPGFTIVITVVTWICVSQKVVGWLCDVSTYMAGAPSPDVVVMIMAQVDGGEGKARVNTLKGSWSKVCLLGSVVYERAY